MSVLLQCFWLLLLLLSVLPVHGHHREPTNSIFPATSTHHDDDHGKPLFLTPYITTGNIEEAQTLAKVGPLTASATRTDIEVESYAGFLTVDKVYNSNLFFWFIPALTFPDTAPVMLWLSGGPGGSSMYGLFIEHGPYEVDSDIKLIRRDLPWTNKYSMLYVDNSVGTGFSFTQSNYGFSTDQHQIAKNLYKALKQFFKLFPRLKRNDFYIAGESYAGKYLPALAYYHYEKGEQDDVPLTGVIIGSGFSDPENMLPAYPDYIYNIGLFDERQRDHFREECDAAAHLIRKGKYKQALDVFDPLMAGDSIDFPTYFTNCTGYKKYFNYVTGSIISHHHHKDFLALPAVRKAIHVGDVPFNDGNHTVAEYLRDDILRSVRDWLAVVMDNYRVLIYSGQLDIIVAHPLTEAMLQNMPWKHRDDYNKAQRSVWKVGATDADNAKLGVAGYVKQVGDFTRVLVLGAGHNAPMDQPERALDMVDRFISGRGF